MFWMLCNMFSKSFPCFLLAALYIAAVQPNSLWNSLILQNLRNKRPPHQVQFGLSSLFFSMCCCISPLRSKLRCTAADLKDCSRNSIRCSLTLSVELEGVPPEPAGPPRAALGLGELPPLADAWKRVGIQLRKLLHLNQNWFYKSVIQKKVV